MSRGRGPRRIQHETYKPIDPRTKMPTVLFNPEHCRFIMEEYELGFSVDLIARHLYEQFADQGMSRQRRDSYLYNARRKVRIVLADPGKWDPRLDEIAVERAFDGDMEVWLNLSHWERIEVCSRILHMRDHQPFHRKWPDEDSHAGYNKWLASIEPDGVSYGSMSDRVRTIARRKVAS